MILVFEFPLMSRKIHMYIHTQNRRKSDSGYVSTRTRSFVAYHNQSSLIQRSFLVKPVTVRNKATEYICIRR